MKSKKIFHKKNILIATFGLLVAALLTLSVAPIASAAGAGNALASDCAGEKRGIFRWTYDTILYRSDLFF